MRQLILVTDDVYLRKYLSKQLLQIIDFIYIADLVSTYFSAPSLLFSTVFTCDIQLSAFAMPCAVLPSFPHRCDIYKQLLTTARSPCHVVNFASFNGLGTSLGTSSPVEKSCPDKEV